MLYERFENEAAFRSDFIRPLLTRLGFVAVAELHGQQEFGKDFVFSELTPFGFLRHYAAVVKHEKKIAQSSTSLCNTLLAQAGQAFSVEFQLPDHESSQRVSNVCVFNSGSITDGARKWLRSQLGEEKYGRNVHIFDSERLFQLDCTSTFRQGELFIPRLLGLKNELRLNVLVWKSILEDLPKFAEVRGSFTFALENFLAAPFLLDKLSLNDALVLLQECRIIDQINLRHLTVGVVENVKTDDIETLKNTITEASSRVSVILDQLEKALDSIKILSDHDT
tara:strand:+ start:842 stop:1681 length:840 start_codon:yes stop_codon:yes gene_type:complete